MRTYPQVGRASRPSGGARIKKILRSRLPERFAGKLPPLLIEVGVGILVSVLLLLVRLALVPWTADRAPYALVFMGVVGAAVIAGWRSGLLALIVGQVSVWYAIADPDGTLDVGEPRFAGLILATISQAVILVIITLYQREIALVSLRRESQLGLLEKALKEIDHRTSNNYQTVLALVLAQSKSADDPAVKEALQQVADRIRAIASASRKLAVASESLEQVRIGEHLHDLCDEIERGLSRPGLTVDCSFDDIVLGTDDTVCVSILVNELVTNALKHAFPDDRSGTIQVAFCKIRNGYELRVEDDGVGIEGGRKSRGTGLGTRLIDTFVKQLGAQHETASSATGTRHRIRIPA